MRFNPQEYVMVDVLQQFRIRYCIPLNDLQKENPDIPVNSEWALDAVTCGDVKEFSQLDLGETIIDHTILSEEAVLEMFNKDNDYLSEWATEKKLEWINEYGEDII